MEKLKIAAIGISGIYSLSLGVLYLFFPRKAQVDTEKGAAWWFLLFVSTIPSRMDPFYVRVFGIMSLIAASLTIFMLAVTFK